MYNGSVQINGEIYLTLNNVICRVKSIVMTKSNSSLSTIQQLWDIIQNIPW